MRTSGSQDRQVFTRGQAFTTATGADLAALERFKWESMYKMLFPEGVPSPATSYTSEVDTVTLEEKAADLRLRRRRARKNSLKRKLRKTFPTYGSDSPDTSGDELFVANTRDVKLPKRPRVGRNKRD
jgi:hypothetical protein